MLVGLMFGWESMNKWKVFILQAWFFLGVLGILVGICGIDVLNIWKLKYDEDFDFGGLVKERGVVPSTAYEC